MGEKSYTWTGVSVNLLTWINEEGDYFILCSSWIDVENLVHDYVHLYTCLRELE